MSTNRFDDLAKALASSNSRREALKAIVATTIGGLLGLGGIGSAFAAQCPYQVCGGRCCSGVPKGTGCCPPSASNPLPAHCPLVTNGVPTRICS